MPLLNVLFPRPSRALSFSVLLATTLGLLAGASVASPQDEAMAMHQRIAGVPAPTPTLQAMVDRLEANDPVAAALLATEHPAFLNSTIKNWVAPASNEPQSVIIEFNDMIATVIGAVRDDVDFREILYEDILYKGPRDYNGQSNRHYRELERDGADYAAVLERVKQSDYLADLPAEATAGIITSRASAEAFYTAGTNRAVVRFFQLNFLCRDMESLTDVSRPTGRIRQDVDRAPSQDPSIYLTNCSGCHAGLDALAGAFAYYDFRLVRGEIFDSNNKGQLVHDPGRVQAKYFYNAGIFPDGYATVDDSWINYWQQGRNQVLGWSPNLPGKGNGAKSLGMEWANSREFASCQVEKAFTTACLREPTSGRDKVAIEDMTDSFIAADYNVKHAFAQAAAYCVTDN